MKPTTQSSLGGKSDGSPSDEKDPQYNVAPKVTKDEQRFWQEIENHVVVRPQNGGGVGSRLVRVLLACSPSGKYMHIETKSTLHILASSREEVDKGQDASRKNL